MLHMLVTLLVVRMWNNVLRDENHSITQALIKIDYIDVIKNNGTSREADLHPDKKRDGCERLKVA